MGAKLVFAKIAFVGAGLMGVHGSYLSIKTVIMPFITGHDISLADYIEGSIGLSEMGLSTATGRGLKEVMEKLCDKENKDQKR